MAASLALTPKHCEIGIYTLRGYTTSCVEALFAPGVRHLWRIGIRQKLAICFAEKLGIEKIGTTGREVYLPVYPAR